MPCRHCIESGCEMRLDTLPLYIPELHRSASILEGYVWLPELLAEVLDTCHRARFTI